ncbi:MAG: DUF58 domain-containing protein [Anaerolineales bacterium]|nr:DUF58 domain-containing protein [Anaerolineales bacterium]
MDREVLGEQAMLGNYILLILCLFVIAALLGDDFVFVVLYLLAGALILGRVLSGRSVQGVVFTRSFVPRAFWGEEVPVQLEVQNSSLLPVLWLRLQEVLPVEVAPPNPMRQVISLGPHGKASLMYSLRARKRGYYPIGPLSASSGDLLGLGGEWKREGERGYLTVYPRIYHLTNLKLPSHSPMGALRHRLPIYEDPTRVVGKRDYTAGDSLRRVDWKASAVAGKMQVKQYEPSIALTTAIYLDLNPESYARQGRTDALELAIVVAASIANWIVGKKQMVGLVTNGLDSLMTDEHVKDQRCNALPPGKGRGHLMRLLDVLARVQAGKTLPITDLLRQEGQRLPWGTTLLLITGCADESLFDQLFWARRAGLNAVLVLVGQVANPRQIESKGRRFGFPVYVLRNESDLDIWRR